MGLADEIREYVLVNYIEPARRRGESTVTVRAGDVHQAMGLKDRMPAVAGAIGAAKFQSYANVRLIRREGPHQGANLFLTFET
jgi:5-methylcytosine-specific restriction protein B